MNEQFSVGSQDPQKQRPTRVFRESEGRLYPHPNEKEISVGTQRNLEAIRAEVLPLLEPAEDGLNLDRTRTFIAQKGLQSTDLHVVDESSRDRVLDTLRKHGLVYDEPQGFFDRTLQLAIVFRDRDLEELNGPEIIETLVIHELAHGSSVYDLLAIADQNTQDDKQIIFKTLVPRSGQAVINIQGHTLRGLFIEEGFAELMRAEYMTESLGLKYGFSSFDCDIVNSTVRENGAPLVAVDIPTKYVHRRLRNGNEELHTYPSSYAGAALELLIGKDPGLRNALVTARQSPAGLREVAQRIDAISPGLYKTLRDAFSDTGKFCLGLDYVAQIIKTNE